MCPTCGYLLASGSPLEPTERRWTATKEPPSRRPVSFREAVENSKKGIALVLVIVIIIILASFYLVYQLHKDDAYLGVTLFYRYSAGNGTVGSNVHVWGDVYNWGQSTGSGKLTITITDDEGHRLVDSFKVGPVEPQHSVGVDKTYSWNYYYDPIEHPNAPIEATYKI